MKTKEKKAKQATEIVKVTAEVVEVQTQPAPEPVQEPAPEPKPDNEAIKAEAKAKVDEAKKKVKEAKELLVVALAEFKKVSKTTTATKTAKTANPLTHFVDELIKKGGTWEELTQATTKESEKRGLITFRTAGEIKSLIKYRTKTNPDFYGKITLTAEGITVE